MERITTWLNRTTDWSRQLVFQASRNVFLLVTMLAAAIGAAMSGASPTGDNTIDAITLGLTGAGLVLLANSGPRLAPVAMPIVGALALSPLVLAAMAASLTLLIHDRLRGVVGHRRSGAIATALAVQGLLRIPDLGFFGLPSLLTGAAVAPLLFPLAWRLGQRQRSATWTWMAPTTLAACIFLVALAVLFQGLRTDLEVGVTAIEEAAQSASVGDSGQMVSSLERSHRAFKRADGKLDSTVARIGRLVPGLSQQIRAADAVVEQAVVLSSTARESGPLIYPDVIYAENGWVAFDLLDRTRRGLAAIGGVVEQSERNIEAVPRNWLFRPLDRALDDASDQLDTLGDQLASAEKGFATIPAMLGADGEQRILVLLTTPAESRERGGFVGAYALLSADRDGLDIVASGPTRDLLTEVEQFTDPSGFSNWFLRYDHARYPQNLTSAPSLRTTYDAVQQVFPTLQGRPVDTVAYIDPAGMSAFVDAVGTIQLPRSRRVLDADEVLEFLLRDQYSYWPDPDVQSERLSEMFTEVFLQFLETGLPAPDRFDAVFGDAVRGGHIAVVTSSETGSPLGSGTDIGAANEFLTDMSLQRAFPGPVDSDVISVVQTNAAPSKLDAYLRRHVDYQIIVDPASGVVQGTVTVDLVSDAPADLPDYVVAGDLSGASRPDGHDILLSVYTPHLVTSASVNGRSTDLVRFEEYGLNRAMARVRVGLGGQTSVVYKFFGELDSNDYSLRILRQPLAMPDQMTVDVIGVGGWVLEPEAGDIAELPAFERELLFGSTAETEADSPNIPLSPVRAATERTSQRTALQAAREGSAGNENPGDGKQSGIQFRLLQDLEIRYQSQAVEL